MCGEEWGANVRWGGGAREPLRVMFLSLPPSVAVLGELEGEQVAGFLFLSMFYHLSLPFGERERFFSLLSLWLGVQ